jgi:hypothetical protein
VEAALNQTIIQAIREKRLLEIRYHNFFRLVEPHCYGRNKKGDYILRCYQIAGGSVSGSPSDWKLLLQDEMKSITMTGNGFSGPRPSYKYKDPAMQSIVAQLLL